MSGYRAPSNRVQLGNTRSIRITVAAMLVLALGACTSGVTRAPEIGLQRPQFDEPGEKAGTLLVSLSEEGKADAKENDKFELATLKKTIRQALEAENLITAKPDPSLPKLEITVTSVRTRSGFTAVMFGFLAGNGSSYVTGTTIDVNGGWVMT